MPVSNRQARPEGFRVTDVRLPTVVMTGATGRIGRLLLAGGKDSDGISVLRSGRMAGEGVDLVWDLTGPAPSLPRGAVILHLAARLSGSGDLVAENLAMVRGVMRAAADHGAARVLLASSAAVYGAQPDTCCEEGPALPLSAYGRAKLASEMAARAWAGAVPLTVLRIGNVPGADALLGQDRRGPVTLDPVPGSRAGPVRSWIGPNRLAEVIFTLAQRAAAGEALPLCMNIASDPALGMGDLLQAAGMDWEFGPTRPVPVPRAVLDLRRLQSILPQLETSADDLVAEWRATRAALA
jgi:nucleoside-diphosphate-sugar epimerase